jgi:ribosomal protein S18 acetylase RimI-like enzyme
MAIPTVRTTTDSDESAVIDTIVLAFAADPVTRWAWADPRQYLATMPGFTRAFGGGAFAYNSAHCTAGYAGAALWLPPGAHPDEQAMGEILERTVADAIRADLFTIFEQMGGHHPDGPHWYLPMIGVDPAHQDQGHGSALLQHALEQCDRDHLPAYLESTNPRNIPLYQRHGFEAIGTIQVGSSPPLIPMLRQAR